ncbi:MAG: hypothetical protein WC789_14505 [Lentisphaeria bacterium]
MTEPRYYNPDGTPSRHSMHAFDGNVLVSVPFKVRQELARLEHERDTLLTAIRTWMAARGAHHACDSSVTAAAVRKATAALEALASKTVPPAGFATVCPGEDARECGGAGLRDDGDGTRGETRNGERTP